MNKINNTEFEDKILILFDGVCSLCNVLIKILDKIPNNNKNKECYVEWVDTNERVYWTEGKIEIFNVEELHQGANNSNEPMEFLYVDVKLDTVVEL